MNIESILKNFGLNEKETAVYLALIRLGPSPVRLLAIKSGVNRGTTYDILKSLIGMGLVSYFNRQSHQYFAAEPPEKLLSALDDKAQGLESLRKAIEASLPQLKSLFENQGGKPAVKLYEGIKGIKSILEDVLETVGRANQKEYYVYSSASLRKDVYNAMPQFSDLRKQKQVSVKTIALGEGGQLVGLEIYRIKTKNLWWWWGLWRNR
ncbi:MAG: TrmB family transcriptional regulator [Candidatus Doudnabacteria bacterium]|nr:TrmB family transcriptional regulator [Candidatus Doudnabacteria bacterium]